MCLTESASDHSFHYKSMHEYANASIGIDYVYPCMKVFISFMCVLDIVFGFFLFSGPASLIRVPGDSIESI